MLFSTIDPHALHQILQAPPKKRSQFIQALDSCVKINLTTGSAKVDEKALSAAFGLVVKAGDLPKLTKSITAFLSPGFMVIDAKRPVVVPWGTVRQITGSPKGRLAAVADLGLKPTMSTREMESVLRNRPDLQGSLSFPGTSQPIAPLMRRDTDTGPDPNVGKHPQKSPDSGGSSYVPPPPLPDPEKCLTSLGTWSGHWWGAQLCVDSQCAESIANWVQSLAGVGDFAKFVSAIVGAGAAAFGGSSLNGFILYVAVAFAGGVFYIETRTADKGNGVCFDFSYLWGLVVESR
jgi:hypothetical protein